MRDLMLVLGLGSVVVVSAWACGSDVETGAGGTTTTTTSSTGGAGGSGGGASSSSSSSSSSSGVGGFASDCEAACYRIEVECQFGPVCDQVPFLDCTDPTSECPGACILDADCGAIASLVNFPNSDPDLMACLQACQGSNPCQDCLIGSCGTQLTACQGDSACQAFLQCALACTPGDGVCIAGCAASNPSTATTDLVDCATGSCASDCLGAGGGGGSGGGSGGGGGAGG